MSTDLLYVNGDSYSHHQNPYSKNLGELLNCPVKNNAVPGSSNNRIIRSTLDDLIDLKNEYNKIFVIIGFSFITRQEIWVDDTKGRFVNKVSAPAGLTTLDYAVQDDLAMAGLIGDVRKHTINAQMIEFYTKIFLLAHTLESMNIDYLFFSGANNQDYGGLHVPHLNSFKQVQWVKENKRILPLDKFSIPQWAKENQIETNLTGHLLENGHIEFSQYLHKLLTNLS
jgi:hypothetical protein